MKIIFSIVGLWLQFLAINSLIVPDEIPTLLSIIYSNVPTVKKGTDSRLGWGFRLGNRADFQVLVELGPQLNTQPLVNQNSAGNSKRNALNNLRNTLYAQQQQKKKNQGTKISNTEGGKWIDQWSQNLYEKPEELNLTIGAGDPVPEVGLGEVDAKAVIPDDSAVLLKALYNKDQKVEKSEKSESTTQKPKTTTSYKDALDNVELDDAR